MLLTSVAKSPDYLQTFTKLILVGSCKGDPRPCIPLCHCITALSAMGLKFRVFGFLPTIHGKINAKQMRPQSLRAVWHFTRVYLHAQTTVDARDIRT